MKNRKEILTCLIIFSAIPGIAQATLYDIVAVLSGDGTFGASGFHDASGRSPMSGDSVADMPNATGLFGTYNDVTNYFSATFGVTTSAGPTVSFGGYLSFDSGGLLASNGTLGVNFTNNNGLLADTTLGFIRGIVCCSGGGTSNPPNTLNNDGSGNLIMTLWGANFSDTAFASNYNGSTLGMDLRVMLTESVPAPTVLILLTIGLLGFTSRRFISK